MSPKAPACSSLEKTPASCLGEQACISDDGEDAKLLDTIQELHGRLGLRHLAALKHAVLVEADHLLVQAQRVQLHHRRGGPPVRHPSLRHDFLELPGELTLLRWVTQRLAH